MFSFAFLRQQPTKVDKVQVKMEVSNVQQGTDTIQHSNPQKKKERKKESASVNSQRELKIGGAVDNLRFRQSCKEPMFISSSSWSLFF